MGEVNWEAEGPGSGSEVAEASLQLCVDIVILIRVVAVVRFVPS